MAQANYGPSGNNKGQAQTRVSRMWRDDHNRVWNSVVDTKDKSGHPCSPLMPVDWLAPVMPDQKYLKPNTENGEQHLDILYDTWLTDLDQYKIDWDTTVDKAALGYARGDQELYFELRATPTGAILEMAGQKPLDRRYVLACKAGDKWALGLTAVYPAWARKIWGDDFVKAVTPAQRFSNDLSFLDEEASGEIKAETRRRTVGVTSG